MYFVNCQTISHAENIIVTKSESRLFFFDLFADLDSTNK